MIYVDEVREYPNCKLPWKRWCHMATDGKLEELHAFAARLGLQRRWFQGQNNHPHYDLVPSKRALALRLGATAVTGRGLLRHCYWGKDEQRQGGLLRDMGKIFPRCPPYRGKSA